MTTGKMKTKLEQIETAAELVTLVSWQGVSTKQEDICRMQDIIGHSTIEELDRLANFTGDKSGKMGTQSYFYHILSVIWRWDDLIEFWNKHTNPEHKQMKEANELLMKCEKELKFANEILEKKNKDEEDFRKRYCELLDKSMDQEKAIAAKDREIMELKAKLYDMMVKENGAA